MKVMTKRENSSKLGKKLIRIKSHVSKPYVYVLLYRDVFKYGGQATDENFGGVFSTFAKCDERGKELVKLGQDYSYRRYRCRKTYIDQIY